MRYLVLGVTEVRGTGGEPVALGGGRARALVAALAVEAGRPVPAETLIDQVWAAHPPADAAGALQALVARVRRALGRDAVTSEPGGYRLAAERDAVDLYAFERLVQEGDAALTGGDPQKAADVLARALALWRGPALADLPERAAAAARPDALRRTARRLHVEAELALGRAADVLPALGEAVAAHPLDEAFRAQLIRALRAAGRSADALVAYEETRKVLVEALGADPGPELRALHAELLRQPAPAQEPATPAPAGNLRARLTSFVGREADLRDIRQDVAVARLVTLTGPGGSGKTRLAQEAAEGAADGFPDGVWLAELAPLDDPAAIPHAVLSALGRREAQGLATRPLRGEAHQDDPVERLLEYCGRRRLLLVLDNCEHVIGGAAVLTAELLAACPGVTVLATSREPLGVPGEVVRPVEPLPPPTAYRLFAERAATVRPGAAPYGDDDGPDAVAVREICRRLDGLPLAIELAAARLRALSPRQIADRLDDRFRLLTSGSRTVLPRQQTLRAVVDWSWDLLTEPERTALRALSVFAGGCTLAAAEAVCGPDALETVAQLVDKSLVVADLVPAPEGQGGPQARYRLLETIHEYAAERAAELPGELARAARRHTVHYRDLALTADPELRRADQMRWLEVLETELDNVRAALHRTVEAGEERDALAIAQAMGWFWWLRNYRDEADSWLEQVVAMGGDPADNPDDPLYWPRTDARMLLYFVKSDHAAEDQLSTPASLAMAEALAKAYAAGGPPAARFPGLLWPFTAYLLGGAPEIRRHTEAVVANCRVHGGDWELATALMFRTHVAVDSPGGLARADDSRAELETLADRLGDRWIRAQVHSASGEIAMAHGDYATARADLEAAHRLGQELGAFAEAAFLIARLGEIAHRAGDDETADRLVARAGEEAERYSVWDARTYVRYLQAVLLLRRGEVAKARQWCDLAAGHASDGTPPPAFRVVLGGLAARITVAEGDPRSALPLVDDALRTALTSGCTEQILGAQLDVAAEVLTALGETRTAVVALAAADAVRGPVPRSVPEQEIADAVAARAAAALSAAEVAAARERGAGLDREQAVALVVAVLADGRAGLGAPDGGGAQPPGTAGE
ncbi:BTAD domain-containing putative transcriptional regulator [Actinacidiphila paucisporea]|uniref:Predicted ATPase n=1 Tax=Actinacidiphila paucisporea TaxID=310782 RepID=A0A1M7QKD2_9ACTN|nr:BTAD domain-containing putative transcriptional regulator [Actinacidiphila paucisporea]SHN31631.1 Predicted ATPase [Actinacidiphila paucisporea]